MRLPSGRRASAIGASRVARKGAHLASHNGTAIPGLVAERIDPTIMAWLAGQLGPVALVAGTNGKTTTVRLLCRILEAAYGVPPITNRSGANLRQGIASTLVNSARLDGRLDRPGAPAVFEVDELAMESVARTFPPQAIVATNLFRDQLDRYGEVEAIVVRWKRTLETVGKSTTFVYCADDPRLENLRQSVDVPGLAFGQDAALLGPSAKADATTESDPVSCPVCGAPYVFAWRSIAHLGDFCCPNGHMRRRDPDVAVGITREDGLYGVEQRFTGAFGSYTADVQLPGLSGAYNTGAAVAAAITLGVAPEAAIKALHGATPAFGRLEEMRLSDRRVLLMLVKNAASLAETQRVTARIAPDSILLGLNDAPADGQDISWIWDADLQPLEVAAAVGLTGTRADDLSLRLKYAPRRDGGEWPIVTARADLDAALMALIERTPVDGTLCVLATYTAMLGVRRNLQDRGTVGAAPR